MKSEEIRIEAIELSVRASSLYTELDNLMAPIRAELAQAATEWIGEELAVQIAENPKTIANLGVARLSDLKKSVAKVLDEMPERFEIHMSDSARWPHSPLFTDWNALLTDTRYSSLAPTEDFFRSAFRYGVSSLSGVLEEFGLLPPSSVTSVGVRSGREKVE